MISQSGTKISLSPENQGRCHAGWFFPAARRLPSHGWGDSPAHNGIPAERGGPGTCAPSADMGQTGATYIHTLSWAKDPGGKMPGALSNTTTAQKCCFLSK